MVLFKKGAKMAELVDADELARLLGVTKATVLTWRRRKWIPSRTMGQRCIRFVPDEVLAAMKTREERTKE